MRLWAATGLGFWDIFQEVVGAVIDCFVGAKGAEEAAAPAEPFIAEIPVVGEAAVAAIPVIGCGAGIVSAHYTGVNFFGG